MCDPSIRCHASIKIEVKPLGAISPSVFKHYFKALSKLSQFSLKEVTPFETSALKLDDGSLAFNFVVSGSKDEGFEVFKYQSHLKTMAVVGICDCSEIGSLTDVEDEFKTFVASQRGKVLSRWCAFGITDEQMKDSEMLQRLIHGGMEIFPPERMTDEGRTSVECHMSVVLGNLCFDLLQRFDSIVNEGSEAIIEVLKQPTGGMRLPVLGKKLLSYNSRAKPETPQRADSLMIEMVGEDFEKLSSKQQAGRIGSFIAGHAMLGCCYRQALQLYNDSIVHCRESGDKLWQAIALEGCASSLFLLKQEPDAGHSIMTDDPIDDVYGFMPPTDTESVEFIDETKLVLIQDVQEALRKAANLYSSVKLVWPLEANATLKLARYLARCGGRYRTDTLNIIGILLRKAAREHEGPRIRHSSADTETHSANSETHQRALGLLFRNICIHSAIIYEHFGLTRKSAFLLQQASFHEMNWGDSLRLLQMAAERIGVVPVYSSTKPNCSFTSWTLIKREILTQLVDAAQNADKRHLAVDYALQLLELLPAETSCHVELSEIIRSCVSVDGFFRLDSTCCFPKLRFIKLQGVPDNLKFHKSKKPNKTIFFTPGAKTGPFDSLWVTNEVYGLAIELDNPIGLEVCLDSIKLFSLCEDISNVECHVSSLKLKPYEHHHSAVVFIRPLRPGIYKLAGCEISSMGLISNHYFETPVEVTVIKEMPSIFIRRLSSKIPIDSRLEFYEGEEFTVEVEMQSQSLASIDDCSLDISLMCTPPPAKRDVSAYDPTIIDSIFKRASEPKEKQAIPDYLLSLSSKVGSQYSKVQLMFPNLPEQNSILRQQVEQNRDGLLPLFYSLDILAVKECRKAQIDFSYSPVQGDFERRCSFQFDCNIEQVLEILYVDIQRCDSRSLLCSVDVQNQSSQTHIFKVSAGTDILAMQEIDPFSITRVHYVIPNPSRQWDDVLSWLKDTVSFKWELKGMDRYGEVMSLGACIVSPQSVSFLGPFGLRIETTQSVNSVVVTICNTFEHEELRMLEVNLFLLSKQPVVFSGTLKFVVDELLPDQQISSTVYFKYLCDDPPSCLPLKICVTETEGKQRLWS